MGRREDIERFYSILLDLERTVGPVRYLGDDWRKGDWPRMGVYFLFETSEDHAGTGFRCVSVGTHALKPGSKKTLWDRLMQHRGNACDLRGHHRSSRLRKYIGAAIIERDGLDIPTWGSSGKPIDRASEVVVEEMVSEYIRDMPLLWVEIKDSPGPKSRRGYIERNSIAMLSNRQRKFKIDPPSYGWLGRHCPHRHVRDSGLRNVDHVTERYNPEFLVELLFYVNQMGSPSVESSLDSFADA